MIDINPDFRTQLEEVRRKGDWRCFRRIPAGPYRLSIQASGKHHCTPQQILRAVEDYDRWEVDVFTESGSWITPKTHPDVFRDPVWSQYWIDWIPSEMRVPATGRYVPTEVVQTFYDFLALGPDLYRELTARGSS